MRPQETEIRFIPNREVRRFPAGWQHPRDERGRHVPLFAEQMREITGPAEIVGHETTSEGTPISPAFPDTREGRLALLRRCAELAAEVQKLRRPPLAPWAANQLARGPDVLLSVREATVEAREAQSRGSATDLRDALARTQRALDGTASAAEEVSPCRRHNATDAVNLGVRELVRLAALRGGHDWEQLASGALNA